MTVAKTQQDAGARPWLSVVIPALNESPGLSAALASVGVRAGFGAGGSGRFVVDGLPEAAGVEVVVADGGSRDDTVALAEAGGARVVRSAAGRGVQLNAGAAAATGEHLLFLHADTRLPAQWWRAVRSAMEQPAVVAGAFCLSYDDPRRSLRWVASAANWRSRRLKLPYGDQALFMRRETFERVGRFPDWPLLEDVALVRRLNKLGRIATVPDAVTTSARRSRAQGVWCGVAVNQVCLLAFAVGVSPQRLAVWRNGPLRVCHAEPEPEPGPSVEGGRAPGVSH